MSHRALFHCVSSTKKSQRDWNIEEPNEFVYDVTLYPVRDGEENKHFFAQTPGGQIQLVMVRSNYFVPGKNYHVSFRGVEEEEE